MSWSIQMHHCAKPIFSMVGKLCSRMLKQTELARWVNRLGCAVAVSLLVACGGGGDGVSNTRAERSAKASNEQVEPTFGGAAVVAKNQALMQEGARLHTAELEAIAKTGVLPKPFDGPLLSGAAGSTKATLDPAPEVNAETKSAASRTAVYRFFNSQTSAHFFTTSVTERDNVRATLPHMAYEGPSFYASGTTVPGLSPVHRFNNNQTGVHFYTISETERAHIAATMPQFVYEGIAYYASTLAGTGYTPLYRFFYGARGFHFYTNSTSEKDTIIATLPQYSYEGVGYHVLGSDWQTPVLPHTGITEAQCYGSTSNSMYPCSIGSTTLLNPQQDGHRAAINPMSYSQVISGYTGAFPILIPLYYPKTDCVRDNVTGLIWEGKEASGARGWRNTYSNRGDGLAGDASAYVASVNAMNLCGYSDWRLPQVEELQGLVAYGFGGDAKIDVANFPNTVAGNYWNADTYVPFPSGKWVIDFSEGRSRFQEVNSYLSVRLVRGVNWSGQRYLTVSASYGGDSANNAVLDRKTGLTWRRCLEGQLWNGSECLGTRVPFTHQSAFTQAANQTGWRLPNIKELAGLSYLSRQIPALDSLAFPGAGGGFDTWSSTPDPGTSNAWYLAFNNGAFSTLGRVNALSVQLVRIDP